ncbi:hypothetical protein HKD37_02G005853 [Glycine soja]
MEAGLLSLDVSFSVTKNTTLHKHNKNCPECVLEVMNLAMDVPSVGTINEGFKNELLHQYEIEKNEVTASVVAFLRSEKVLVGEVKSSPSTTTRGCREAWMKLNFNAFSNFSPLFAEATSSRQIASGSAQNEVLKEWQDAWDERDKDFEKQGINQQDSFWSKLKSEAARKVNEELSLDAARSFLNSS